jgi:Prophage CP4-57 regulatory protein (AlpA)
MSDLLFSAKSVITVSEMAEMCQLSRSRFYDLMEAGVFPKPVLHPSSKRPMYDRGLQEKCLEIKETGIGANGAPVLFNRKPKKAGQPKAQRKAAQDKTPDHADLLAALKGLGLTTTAQAVADALTALFPTGQAELDQGDVIRRLFLHLQGKKK